MTRLLFRRTGALTPGIFTVCVRRMGIAVMVLLLGSATVSHGQETGDFPGAPVAGEESEPLAGEGGGEVILHDTGEAGSGASSVDVGGGVILHDMGDGTTGTSIDVGDGMIVHDTDDGRSGTSLDMGDGVILHEAEDGSRSISVDEGDGVLIHQGGQ